MRGFHLLFTLCCASALAACSGMVGGPGGGAAPGSENLVTDHSVGGLQNAAMPGQTGGAPAPDPDRGEKAFAYPMQLEDISSTEEKSSGVVHLRGKIPCAQQDGAQICFSGRVLRLVNVPENNYLDEISQGAADSEAVVEWKLALSVGAASSFSLDSLKFFIAPVEETTVANMNFQACTEAPRCAPKDWGGVPVEFARENKSTLGSSSPEAPPLPPIDPTITRPAGPIPRPSK